MNKYEVLKQYKDDGLLSNVEIWLSDRLFLQPTDKTVLFYNEEHNAIMLTNVYVHFGTWANRYLSDRYVITFDEIISIDI